MSGIPQQLLRPENALRHRPRRRIQAPAENNRGPAAHERVRRPFARAGDGLHEPAPRSITRLSAWRNSRDLANGGFLRLRPKIVDRKLRRDVQRTAEMRP